MPPDALASWQGWDIVDPGYVGVMLVWWPVDSLARLAILAWLMKAAAPSAKLRPATSALLPAIHAEVLLSVRVGIVCLLGWVPALTLLALQGVELPAMRLAILGLGLVGLLPALVYYVRRSLAFGGLLRQPMGGPAALEWSRARLQGRLKGFVWLALPWWILCGALEGLTLLLSLGDNPSFQGLSWLIATPSLVASLLPIALFVASDETL